MQINERMHYNTTNQQKSRLYEVINTIRIIGSAGKGLQYSVCWKRQRCPCPRHEHKEGEQRFSSTHSELQHYIGDKPHAPAALPLGKKLSVPTGQNDGLSPGPLWTLWRRAGTLTPVRTRTPNHPVRSLVTIPPELYRLR